MIDNPLNDSKVGPLKKVLVVDDEPNIRKTVRRHLIRAGYDFYEADNGVEALEIINREKPLVVLLDIMMPGMNGLEVCGKIKKGANSDLVFVILFSAKAKEEDKLLGLSAGGDDYIVKPFNPVKLLGSINSGFHKLEMRYLANYDMETNLFNYSYFFMALYKEAEKSKRFDREFSIVMLKPVPLTSDKTDFLKSMAKVISNKSRVIDTVARWSDLKIIILMPETTHNEADSIVKKLNNLFWEEKEIKDQVADIKNGIATNQIQFQSVLDILQEVEKKLYR